MTETLQDKIDKIFYGTWAEDNIADTITEVNKTIQELRQEIISKRRIASASKTDYSPYNHGYNEGLLDVLALIGEKK